MITTAVSQFGPQLVVIDSVKAAYEALASPAVARRILYTMASLAVEAEFVALLVGEYTEDQLMTLPDAGVADGIISLSSPYQSTEDARFLRVLKMRGGSHVHARREFNIDNTGITVLPGTPAPKAVVATP